MYMVLRGISPRSKQRGYSFSVFTASLLVSLLPGVTSAVIAAPLTGTTSISGSMMPGTCIVTFPSSVTILPVTTVNYNDNKNSRSIHSQDLNINITSCSPQQKSSIRVTFNASEGVIAGNGLQGYGKFSYSNRPKDDTTSGPLVYSVGTEGNGNILFNVNNTGEYSLMENDNKKLILSVISNIFDFDDKPVTDYAGNYSASLGATIKYN